MATSTTDFQTHVEALAASDPAWLADLRREAAASLEHHAYPTGREEHWRYTDVGLLRPEQFDPLPPDEPAPTVPDRARTALRLAGLEAAGVAVHANGALASLELSPEARRAGVIFTDLGTAVREHGDLLRPRLGALFGAGDVFTAWSLAAHRGGTFLHVPAGVELVAPFQALHWASAEGAALWPRTVVVVEDHASVTFNDVYASAPFERPTLAAPTVELYAGRGARVGWVTWQDWGPGVRHLAHVKAHLDREAVLRTLLVTLGGDFSRTWKECTLAGEGAESYMFGLSFAHGQQHFEHWTVQDHAAPHTTSDLLYKSALDDESRTVYYGTIRVRREARRTDAYQANRNLTLSPHARADTNPQLEIETNDVRCTHGATVGRVDENQLFYLTSRGIPRPEAELLVVFGFFNQVLDQVRWSGMHERLAEAIHAKLEARP